MKRGKIKNILLASLAALALTASLAACGKAPEPADTSSEPVSEASPSSSGHVFINTLPELVVNSRFPRLTAQVEEKYALNDHTVGWLQIPETPVDEEILCYTAPDDNNNYYYRRDFNRRLDSQDSFAGVLYADFRCRFGDGTRDQLSNNTVIYGHNLGRNLDPNLEKKFAPLQTFNDEEFAKATPYIYFSTAAEDFIWEVFAVFYATVELPYNIPTLSGEEFGSVLSECVKRSIYTYDTQVSATDKVLTLSTCTYSVPGIGTVSYPNDYRYVVMAKLIDKSEAVKTEAVFEVNQNPKAP